MLPAEHAARDAAARRHLEAAIGALAGWLAGSPSAFSRVDLDLADLRPWDRAVLDAVRAIPWGATLGYGEVARMIGRPGAARAVGGAVRRNPIGLAIPCHRVIAGDGTLGGYGGGLWGPRERLLEIKRLLLAHEGALVLDRPARAGRRGRQTP